MRGAWLVVIAACGNGTSQPASSPSGTTATPGAPELAAAPVVAATCEAAVPDRACKPGVGLRVCKPGDKDQVGEWRYAIAAPPFTRTEDITKAELEALWKKPQGLAASADTIAALTTQLGAGGAAVQGDKARPEVTDTQWAILPADELVPNWKVVSVDGVHPLGAKPGVLAVPLCSATKTAVRNIDPEKLTVLVMTGTTAATRFTSKLMEEKGVLYPLSSPGVEPWLAAADFVHISNEVSFLPKCDTGDGKPTMAFCSKENYIELFEKSHVNIVELTGNHLHDYGHDWLGHTIEMYEKRGWKFFGGGRTQLEAVTPRLVEHHGNKLAFLGCNMPHTDWKVIRTEQPDVGACDIARMQWEIRDLRSRGYVPIVSIQHDEVYKHDPPAGLVRDLRQVADAGPAFVMGSQAHCPHPWEVHRGAYMHYGPGNIYFDQFWHPVRDAAQDKLYIHAGKLLTVGHLYTRIEERGRPRVLDVKERGELLADLAKAQARLPKAEPWAAPVEGPADKRERPDSVLVKGVQQTFLVRTPATLEDGKKYPLVIARSGETDDNAFVVTLKKTSAPNDKLLPAITRWMEAKYPVEPSVKPEPKKRAKK
jgi:hypothetical protein